MIANVFITCVRNVDSGNGPKFRNFYFYRHCLIEREGSEPLQNKIVFDQSEKFVCFLSQSLLLSHTPLHNHALAQNLVQVFEPAYPYLSTHSRIWVHAGSLTRTATCSFSPFSSLTAKFWMARCTSHMS